MQPERVAGGPYRRAGIRDDAGDHALYCASACVVGARARGRPGPRGSSLASGTRVYVRHVFDGGQRVEVVGRIRGTRRYACALLSPAHLTAAGVRRVTSPALVARLTAKAGTFGTSVEGRPLGADAEDPEGRAAAEAVVELLRGALPLTAR